MRIVGGAHRGTRLADVGAGDTVAHLRPTADRVRESLFNILMQGRWGNLVADARVLDLFAGTGALGLEALSRGASHATFVDDGKVAARLIADNIARLRRGADTTVLRLRAADLPQTAAPCTLVFLDPPYSAALGLPALTTATAQGWLAPQATVVWEEAGPQPAPSGFTLRDSRRYGDTWVTILEAP